MIKEDVGVAGRLSIQLFDETGNLKDSREVKNRVVSSGRVFIAQSMLKTTTNTPTAMSHLGIGTAIMAVTNYIATGTTTVTATVASTAVLATGNTIVIENAAGTEQAKLNGTYPITVVNATTFTFVVGTAVTTGTYTTTLGTLYIKAGLNNSALMGELGTRDALDTSTSVTTTYTNDTTQYVATFAAGNATGAIREAGIFNALTSGTMLCRTYFDVINKGANDSLKITWKIQVTSS